VVASTVSVMLGGGSRVDCQVLEIAPAADVIIAETEPASRYHRHSRGNADRALSAGSDAITAPLLSVTVTAAPPDCSGSPYRRCCASATLASR